MKDEEGQWRRKVRPEDDGMAVTFVMLCRSSLYGEETEAKGQKQKIRDKEEMERRSTEKGWKEGRPNVGERRQGEQGEAKASWF